MAKPKANKETIEETAIAGEAVSDNTAATSAASDEKPDWAVKAEAAGYKPKKTIGESKFDNRAYVGWAGVGTFILSVGIAYILRDGRMNIPW